LARVRRPRAFKDAGIARQIHLTFKKTRLRARTLTKGQNMTLTVPSITISPEVIEKLSERVSFADAASVNEFVADAINSYLMLGQLHQSGGEFLFQAEGSNDLIVLDFPFQQD
jgi:hypothetical protein